MALFFFYLFQYLHPNTVSLTLELIIASVDSVHNIQVGPIVHSFSAPFLLFTAIGIFFLIQKMICDAVLF